jgi:hypothetical protein
MDTAWHYHHALLGIPPPACKRARERIPRTSNSRLEPLKIVPASYIPNAAADGKLSDFILIEKDD